MIPFQATDLQSSFSDPARWEMFNDIADKPWEADHVLNTPTHEINEMFLDNAVDCNYKNYSEAQVETNLGLYHAQEPFEFQYFGQSQYENHHN